MKHNNRRNAKREIASLCRLMDTTQCTGDNMRELKEKIRSIEASLRDGEPERDEAEIEQRRAVLASNQGLSDVFNSLWMTVAVMTDENNCLTKRGYVRFFLVLAKVLGSYVSEEETRPSVEEDFLHDTEVYGPISKTIFFDLIFEVIETWAVFVDPTYYSAFAWAVLDGVAELRSQPPKLRPLRSVRCMMQASDEAKLLSAYYDSAAKKERVQLKLQASVMERIPDVQKRLAGRRTGSAPIDEGQLSMIAAIARQVQTPPGGGDVLTDSDDEDDDDGNGDKAGGDAAAPTLSEGSVNSHGSYFRRRDEGGAESSSKRMQAAGRGGGGGGGGVMGRSSSSARDSWLYRDTASMGVYAASAGAGRSEFSNWVNFNKGGRDFAPVQFDLEGYRIDDAGQRVPFQDSLNEVSGAAGRQTTGKGYLASTEASASRVSTLSRGSSSRAKSRARSSGEEGGLPPSQGATFTDAVDGTLPFPTNTTSEVAATQGSAAEVSGVLQVALADNEAEGGELAALMATLADVSARDQAARQAAAEEQAREDARRKQALAEVAEQARLEAARASERAEEMRRAEERERKQDEAKLSLFFSEILHRELVVTPAKLRRQELALDRVERDSKPSVFFVPQVASTPAGLEPLVWAQPGALSSLGAVSSVSISKQASPRHILLPPSLGAPSPPGISAAPAAASSLLFVGEVGASYNLGAAGLEQGSGEMGLRVTAEPALESFLLEGSVRSLASASLCSLSPSPSPSRSPSPSPSPGQRHLASLSEPSVLKAFPHELYSDVVKQVAKEGRGVGQSWDHRRAANFRKRPVGRALATAAERAARDLLALQGGSTAMSSPAGAEVAASFLAPSRAARLASPQRGRPGPSAHSLLHDGPPPRLLTKAQRSRMERDRVRQLGPSTLPLPVLPFAGPLGVDTDSLASVDAYLGTDDTDTRPPDGDPALPRPLTDTLPEAATIAFTPLCGPHIVPSAPGAPNAPAARPFAPHASFSPSLKTESVAESFSESFLVIDSLSEAPPEVFIGDFAPRRRRANGGSASGSAAAVIGAAAVLSEATAAAGAGSRRGSVDPSATAVLVGVQVAVGPRGSLTRRRSGEGKDEGMAAASRELAHLSSVSYSHVDRTCEEEAEVEQGPEQNREHGPEHEPSPAFFVASSPLEPLSPPAASAPPPLSPLPSRPSAPGSASASKMTQATKAPSLSVRSYLPAGPARTRNTLPVLVLERAMDVDAAASGEDEVAARAGALGLAGPLVSPSPEVLRTTHTLAVLQGPRPGMPLTLTRALGVPSASAVSSSASSSAPWLPGGLLDDMEHNRSSRLLAWAEQSLLRAHTHSDPSVVLSVKRQDGVRRCFDAFALSLQAGRAHNDAAYQHFAARERMAAAAVVGSKKGTHGFNEKFSHKRELSGAGPGPRPRRTTNDE